MLRHPDRHRRSSLFAPAAVALLLAASTLLLGCGERSVRATLGGPTMGTTWSIIYTASEEWSEAELQALVEQELRTINAALSTYIPDSEISRLNSAPGALRRELSPRFATVLDSALHVGELTDGAYDVTVGPLVDLWGFGARGSMDAPPSAAAIADARQRVGAQRLGWSPADRMLARPAGMRIDLSSVAKGYAVDQLSGLLAERGIENSLVEVGGELRARGERPEGGPWRLAVESPDPRRRRVIEAISVNNAAVATSGDYRNYFKYEGKRYSHLVDPRTGYPVAHELVSVTVIHEDCMTADALATALIVMGLDAARELAEQRNIAAYFVSHREEGDGQRDEEGEGQLEVYFTAAFSPYRQAADAEPTRLD